MNPAPSLRKLPDADHRYALIIANSRFEDPDLRKLEAPTQDAEALARVLEAPRIGAFSIKKLVNDNSDDVAQEIEGFFAERQPDDFPLLYFSGHGLKDQNGRLYLATANTRRKLLRSTAINSGFIAEVMNETLRVLGTFRAVDSEGLAELGYAGNSDRIEQDLKNLIRQSLVVRRGIKTSRNGQIQVLTLTRVGQRFLRKQRLMHEGQSIHYGLVKPKEARHDTTLYRVYQKAARQIEREGGKVRTVALDYDLKRRINKQLARLGPERQNQDRKNEIAQTHGVRVVNGRVVVPDLQIEYENAEGQLARVNLELATKHYRSGQLETKAKAGFTLYAAAQDADRLRRILNDREITAEILSL